MLTLAIRRTMSTKNWPKVSSKEKLAEVKGERVRDSRRLLKTRYLILLQLNGLNNKSNYKNRKTNYTKIEEVDEDFAQIAKTMAPRITLLHSREFRCFTNLTK